MTDATVKRIRKTKRWLEARRRRLNILLLSTSKMVVEPGAGDEYSAVQTGRAGPRIGGITGALACKTCNYKWIWHIPANSAAVGLTGFNGLTTLVQRGVRRIARTGTGRKQKG